MRARCNRDAETLARKLAYSLLVEKMKKIFMRAEQTKEPKAIANAPRIVTTTMMMVVTRIAT